VIWSEKDPQQGDPLGLLLFCLTVQPRLNSLQSPLVAGYMDDFTLGGPEDVVYRDIAVVTSTGTSLGLHLNVATCELVHPQGSAIKSAVLRSFRSTAPDEATLHGAPLLPSKSLDTELDMCCSNLSKAISRLSHIEAHDTLVLLRSCFCAPRIQHILRCTPCHDHQALTTFDDLLKSGLMVVTNCNLSDVQWLQACLPGEMEVVESVELLRLHLPPFWLRLRALSISRMKLSPTLLFPWTLM